MSQEQANAIAFAKQEIALLRSELKTLRREVSEMRQEMSNFARKRGPKPNGDQPQKTV